MAMGKRRGTGTINKATHTSLTKEQKTMLISVLTDEGIEKMLDKKKICIYMYIS